MGCILVACNISFCYLDWGQFSAADIKKLIDIEGNMNQPILVNKYIANVENSFPAKTLSSPWNPLVDGWKAPSWITCYLQWHSTVRSTHPFFNVSKNESNNNTMPPPLLVVFCGLNSPPCGGLHDRLGSLPFDLFIANQTRRLLFYVWEKPMSIHSFFSPNLLNWRLDDTPLGHTLLEKLHLAPNIFDFERQFSSNNEASWKDTLPKAIEYALNHSLSVLTMRHMCAHMGEYFLENILKQLGETDMIHSSNTFGWIWNAMFQPSPDLHNYLESMSQRLNLRKGQYVAVHVRLHYPYMIASHAGGIPLKTIDNTNETLKEDDKVHAFDGGTGLLLEGAGKIFAVNLGMHAINCARTLISNVKEPIYFFSDANNLAEFFMERNHSNGQNQSDETHIDQQADSMLAATKVCVRPDIHRRNLHLDLHNGISNASDYFATFADLYYAMEARCIVFGYGAFARFARQLSCNSCYLQHQKHVHFPYYGNCLNLHENVCTKDSYSTKE